MTSGFENLSHRNSPEHQLQSVLKKIERLADTSPEAIQHLVMKAKERIRNAETDMERDDLNTKLTGLLEYQKIHHSTPEAIAKRKAQETSEIVRVIKATPNDTIPDQARKDIDEAIAQERHRIVVKDPNPTEQNRAEKRSNLLEEYRNQEGKPTVPGEQKIDLEKLQDIPELSPEKEREYPRTESGLPADPKEYEEKGKLVTPDFGGASREDRPGRTEEAKSNEGTNPFMKKSA